MALLDDVLVPVVKNVLTTLGVSITIKRSTAPVYDPRTGISSAGASSVIATSAPPSPLKKFMVNEVDFKKGDVFFLIAAEGLSIVPNPATDKIEHSGQEWKVVSVESIYSGDSVAAYNVQARR